MNVGMSIAKGDYIGILESDDQYVKGAIEDLLSIAFSTQADVVKGNYYLYQGSYDEAVYFENLKNLPYDQCISSSEYEQLFLTGPAIWSGIYKRQFLEDNKIAFLNTPGASYQDTSFTFKVWAKAEKVVLTHSPVIYYRLDNSDSSSNSSGKVFEIFKETEEMDRFLADNDLLKFSAVCMAAKFRALKWNLDRLNQHDKIRFITRLHENARADCVSGYFQKKYWRDYDWMIMNNVLFNLTGYCKAIKEGREPRFMNESLYESLRDIPLYIISSSREGEVMLAEIWNYGMDICGYINHELINEMVSISAPVVALEAVDCQSMVLISALEPKLEELIQILKDHNIANYVVL